MNKLKLYVCTEGKHCRKQGGEDAFRALRQEIDDWGLSGACSVRRADCLGKCGKGPAVYVKQWRKTYLKVDNVACQLITRAIAEQKCARNLPAPPVPALVPVYD